jgi:hypothetical protein
MYPELTEKLKRAFKDLQHRKKKLKSWRKNDSDRLKELNGLNFGFSPKY